MNPLVWTTEKPTKDGYYWWCGKELQYDMLDATEIIEVWFDPESTMTNLLGEVKSERLGNVWRFGSDWAIRLEDISGQFAGPISKPSPTKPKPVSLLRRFLSRLIFQQNEIDHRRGT